MMMIIDRFEGSLAVLETDSGNISLLREQLPKEAREGDVIAYIGGRYVIDAVTTAKRRRETSARTKRLLGIQPQTDGDKYD